jgi:hypothetical protein
MVAMTDIDFRLLEMALGEYMLQDLGGATYGSSGKAKLLACRM